MRRSPRTLSWLLFSVFVLVAQAAAIADGGFVDRVYQDDDGDHKYVVFEPAGYAENPGKSWPVILFLHGAGERGDDGRLQTTIGLGPVVKRRAASFPAFVVFPQCEDTKSPILQNWLLTSKEGQRAIAILKDVEKNYRIDTKRRTLTGWSMGGYGSWGLGAATATMWQCVVPMSGGGDPETVQGLKDVPVWAFHGTKDMVVRPTETRKMVDALEAAGGDVRYTEMPAGDHNIWTTAYDSDELIRWMLDPVGQPNGNLTLRVNPGIRPAVQPVGTAPFIPAVEIPGAVSVRLGNAMLDALSYSVPKMIPADLVRGRVDDIYDSTVAQGRSFGVTLSGISYTGQVTRCKIAAYEKDKLNVQLGLENLHMQIGGAYVSGQNHSASTGAISIVIGHQRPVWLSVVVTPYVENRRLRMRLVATRFDIPNDNWYVTSPAGVWTRGLGMTREKVVDGLVSGLYGRKATIEQKVRDAVPAMIPELEKRLELAEMDSMLASVWPLPVYRPRMRVWPQAVKTDEGGVSLVLGVTAAAIDGAHAPEEPLVVSDVGASLAQVPDGKNLWMGIAPGILKPLTQMLIDEDVARIHVGDIPEKKFALLADRSVLVEAIPDLEQYGDDVEIWSELILSAPLAASGATADGRNQLEFGSRRLLLSLAVKPDPKQDEWQPYAEFAFTIRQKADVSLRKPTATTRALRLDWIGDADLDVSGRFAPGYQPKNSAMDTERVHELLADAWRSWTQSGPVSDVLIEDLDFGNSSLRLSDVGWSSPNLFAELSVPGVKLTNSSEKALVYETKGPYSGWGGPYTLEPGKSHEFEIPYPLTYRSSSSGTQEMYTLPPGSHSEFRVPSSGGAPGLFEARDEIPESAPAAMAENPAEGGSESDVN